MVQVIIIAFLDSHFTNVQTLSVMFVFSLMSGLLLSNVMTIFSEL